MATDDHDHGHDHGHGHAELAWEIIPENSGADRFLIALAFACLLGLFAFAGLMVTATPHHEEHGGASTHETAPTGTEHGAHAE